MTTKKQALDRALGVIRERLTENDAGGTTHLQHRPEGLQFRLLGPLDDGWEVFSYAPPVEAPPAGSIVECWPNEYKVCLAYSSGAATTEGKLRVSENKKDAMRGYHTFAAPNWRVIKEAD